MTREDARKKRMSGKTPRDSLKALLCGRCCGQEREPQVRCAHVVRVRGGAAVEEPGTRGCAGQEA